MNENQKPRRTSLLNKWILAVAAAAIVVTITLSAGGFVYENMAARSYERSQSLDGVNACGNNELPLNSLCDNVGSEIQGDENAVGMTSYQKGGGTVDQPYENLIEEVSLQEERTQVLNTEKNSIRDRNNGAIMQDEFDRVPGFSLVTPNPGSNMDDGHN
jgi:hypothetical protein